MDAKEAALTANSKIQSDFRKEFDEIMRGITINC